MARGERVSVAQVDVDDLLADTFQTEVGSLAVGRAICDLMNDDGLHADRARPKVFGLTLGIAERQYLMVIESFRRGELRTELQRARQRA